MEDPKSDMQPLWDSWRDVVKLELGRPLWLSSDSIPDDHGSCPDCHENAYVLEHLVPLLDRIQGTSRTP